MNYKKRIEAYKQRSKSNNITIEKVQCALKAFTIQFKECQTELNSAKEINENLKKENELLLYKLQNKRSELLGNDANERSEMLEISNIKLQELNTFYVNEMKQMKIHNSNELYKLDAINFQKTKNKNDI